MKYEKPEVVAFASATRAIQAGEKGINTPPDASLHLPTVGAYESDE